MMKKKRKPKTRALKRRHASRRGSKRKARATKRKAKPHAAPKKKAKKVSQKKPQPVGKVIHFYTNLQVAIIELSKPLHIGDRIRIQGHTTNFTQTVSSMQIDHKPMRTAKKGDVIGLKVKEHVRGHDVVCRLG